MQVWLVIYLAIWSASAFIYGLIYYLLNYYEQPLRIIFIYLVAVGVIVYYMVFYGSYGVLNFTALYVPLLAAAKLLESLRNLLLDFAMTISLNKFDV